ncbi:hypothetical protein [uncultured Thiocystis sp.]|jgi:hypothetical protein|uniref:hypothetical protein n=1 Tax=uncultured Thiocystis sp. TaxID=1202134 RepID=UPI0025FB132B|nr:hypothetical protein [uncultured Thiocystis sp.]
MSVQALLNDLACANVRLSLTADTGLEATGDRAALDCWLPVIRARKDELRAQLAATTPPPLTGTERADLREAIEERAAILEFDGHLSRAQAETAATSAMRVYRYRLSDRPTDWLIMLAPGCDLEEARRVLALRFGSERVIEVACNPGTS